MGLHLSFSGAITRPGARRGPAALAAVAPDRLLLETDAPFGPKAGWEPGDLEQVVQAAARIRGVAPATLSALAHDNAMLLFGRLLP